MCHHQFTESLDGQHQMDERGKILKTMYCNLLHTALSMSMTIADHFATINKWLIVKEEMENVTSLYLHDQFPRNNN